MNLDQTLQLQSYLDGELSSGESRQVTELLAKDAEARAIFEELKMTRTALAGNELEIKLPESRDFYFSKIKRQIEAEERRAQPVRSSVQMPLLARLARYILPVGGLAAAAAALMFIERSPSNASYVPGEGESSGEMAAYTYRSQSDRMTVVWLQDSSSGTSDSLQNDSGDATEVQ